MKPVPVEQPRFVQPTEIMMLDTPEITLQLGELAQTTSIRDPKAAPVPPVHLADFYTELWSAASMIMDREECEAMAKEFEMAQRVTHSTAA
ncbi:MAG TPA: hypothetical protein VF865_20630 [Acidobacteriaceae bacterium]